VRKEYNYWRLVIDSGDPFILDIRLFKNPLKLSKGEEVGIEYRENYNKSIMRTESGAVNAVKKFKLIDKGTCEIARHPSGSYYPFIFYKLSGNTYTFNIKFYPYFNVIKCTMPVKRSQLITERK
jgi:hypothetical protein